MTVITTLQCTGNGCNDLIQVAGPPEGLNYCPRCGFRGLRKRSELIKENETERPA